MGANFFEKFLLNWPYTRAEWHWVLDEGNSPKNWMFPVRRRLPPIPLNPMIANLCTSKCHIEMRQNVSNEQRHSGPLPTTGEST
jgi:hypothetical protein